MNKFEKTEINKKKASRLFTVLMLCFCFLPLMINCVALKPLLVSISSDILYENSILLYVIDYLMAFFEILALAVPFTIVIFSAFLGSRKITFATVIIFVISLLLQIPMSALMNIPLYGTIGSFKYIVFTSIPILTSILLCITSLIVLYLIVASKRKKFFTPVRSLRKMNIKNTYDPQLLPVKNIYSRSNPLQISALAMSIIIVAPKLILHLTDNIIYGFSSELGGIIGLIISYLTDIAYGFLAYIISMLIFSFAHDKLVVKNTDEADTPSEKSDLLD